MLGSDSSANAGSINTSVNNVHNYTKARAPTACEDTDFHSVMAVMCHAAKKWHKQVIKSEVEQLM